MAMVEALIDFGEGEDIEEGVYDHGESQIFWQHRPLLSTECSEADGIAATPRDIKTSPEEHARRNSAFRSPSGHLWTSECREEQLPEFPRYV